MNASRRAAGFADALADAVAVGHRDGAMLAQPLVVVLAGQPDDGRAGVARELHGERPHAAGRAGDRDHVAFGERHCADGGDRGRPHDEERARRLPRHRARSRREVLRLGHDELGVAGAVVREADDLVADGDALDPGADRFDDAGEVAALPGREGRRPAVVHGALADGGLARIDPRRLHAHEHLALAGGLRLHVDDVEDVDSAVPIESHRLWHRVLLGW